MVYHSSSLLVVSILPTVMGISGWIYAVGAVVLGIAMLSASLRSARDMTPRNARAVFFGSLLYQPLLLALLLIDTLP
jgi:protoheme IX farnesyltransferase